MEIVSFAATMKFVGNVSKAGFDMSGDPASSPLISLSKSLTDGVGDDKAESLYFATGTIAAAQDEDIDLFGGVTDVFGDTISFTKIKAFAVLNVSDAQSSPTTAGIQVGGGSNGAGLNAFDTWITSTAADGSEALIIPAGGGHMIFNRAAAGYACSAGNDVLRILNLHGADVAAYEVMVVGEIT